MLNGHEVVRTLVVLLALAVGACGQPGDSGLEPQVLYRGTVYRQGELLERGLPVPHYAVTEALLRQGVLAGFDSEVEATAFLSQSRASTAAVAPCGEPSYSTFHYRSHVRGASFLRLKQGEGAMHLNTWDDNIKSLRVSECPGFVTLYEHAGFGGKTLAFDAGVQIDRLTDFKLSLMQAWGEDASSLRSIAYFDFKGSQTDSARQQSLRVSVPLMAGQIFQVGTCGLQEASGTGDTFLRLYDPRGKEIAANDDQCGALSFLSYTVPAGASGSYELQTGCFGDSTCQGRVAYTYFWRNLAEAPSDIVQGQ